MMEAWSGNIPEGHNKSVHSFAKWVDDNNHNYNSALTALRAAPVTPAAAEEAATPLPDVPGKDVNEDVPATPYSPEASFEDPGARQPGQYKMEDPKQATEYIQRFLDKIDSDPKLLADKVPQRPGVGRATNQRVRWLTGNSKNGPNLSREELAKKVYQKIDTDVSGPRFYYNMVDAIKRIVQEQRGGRRERRRAKADDGRVVARKNRANGLMRLAGMTRAK